MFVLSVIQTLAEMHSHNNETSNQQTKFQTEYHLMTKTIFMNYILCRKLTSLIH